MMRFHAVVFSDLELFLFKSFSAYWASLKLCFCQKKDFILIFCPSQNIWTLPDDVEVLNFVWFWMLIILWKSVLCLSVITQMHRLNFDAKVLLWISWIHNIYIRTVRPCCFLALVHLIPSWLVWAEIKCIVHVALPKWPTNQFLPVQ